MKLNRIQQTIYEEYQKVGRVWADCPRGCGKTTIMIKIIVEELLKDKKVSLGTIHQKQFKQIEQKIKEALALSGNETKIHNLINNNDLISEISINDEVYYDLHKKKQNHQKILCLRTRPHKLFNFTYLDLDIPVIPVIFSKEEIERKKKELSSEQFDLEFNLPIEGINKQNEQTSAKKSMSQM